MEQDGIWVGERRVSLRSSLPPSGEERHDRVEGGHNVY